MLLLSFHRHTVHTSFDVPSFFLLWLLSVLFTGISPLAWLSTWNEIYFIFFFLLCGPYQRHIFVCFANNNQINTKTDFHFFLSCFIIKIISIGPNRTISFTFTYMPPLDRPPTHIFVIIVQTIRFDSVHLFFIQVFLSLFLP